MKNTQPSPLPKFRVIRVYIVAVKVLFSYGWFNLCGFFAGNTWKSQRLVAVNKVNAARIARMMMKVKGLYIKVGQLLSILSNFLPEDFRKELEGLQDQAPYTAGEQIRKLLRNEWGEDLFDSLQHFDPNPLASASLAQVHLGRLENGEKVAIKIQHPHIAQIANSDLKTMRRLIRVFAWISKLRGLDFAYQQVRTMIHEELDFKKEAENLKQISGFFKAEPHLSFPQVFDKFSTEKVLTTTFLKGKKITEIDNREQAQSYAKQILQAYCEMVFVHGVYHADPHPGNILVLENGNLAFLDFGAISQLSPKMKQGLVSFLGAILRGNRSEIIQALETMGFVLQTAETEVVDRLIGYVQRRFLAEIPLESFNLKDIKMDVQTKMDIFRDLNSIEISFRDIMSVVQVPKEWVLLHRTLLLLLGLSTQLDPNLNPVNVLRPYVETTLLGQHRNWADFITSVVKDLVVSALTMPKEMSQAIKNINSGNMKIRLLDPSRNQVLRLLGQQLTFSILGLGMGVISYWAHSNGDQTISRWCAGAAIIFGLGWIRAMWRGNKY